MMTNTTTLAALLENPSTVDSPLATRVMWLLDLAVELDAMPEQSGDDLVARARDEAKQLMTDAITNVVGRPARY